MPKIKNAFIQKGKIVTAKIYNHRISESKNDQTIHVSRVAKHFAEEKKSKMHGSLKENENFDNNQLINGHHIVEIPFFAKAIMVHIM